MPFCAVLFLWLDRKICNQVTVLPQAFFVFSFVLGVGGLLSFYMNFKVGFFFLSIWVFYGETDILWGKHCIYRL